MTRPPWAAEFTGGRMRGRGAADMKAGVAAMVHATRALRESGVRPRGDLSVVALIEEETLATERPIGAEVAPAATEFS